MSASSTTSAREPRASSRTWRPRRRAILALALLALAVGLVAVFAVRAGLQSQPRLNGTDGIFPSEDVVALEPAHDACQSVRVPAGTGALELPIAGDPGEGGLRAKVIGAQGQVIATSGRDVRRGGWARFEFATPTPNAPASSVCIENLSAYPSVILRGSLAGAGVTLDRAATPGGITIQFVRPGRESLFAMIPVIAERIGLVREVIGGWPRALLIGLLTLAGMALSGVLLTGRLRRRAALACAAVAVLNAFAWSLLTPVFQIPDEPAHTSYVQDLAIKHTAPRGGEPSVFSPDLLAVIPPSNAGSLNFNPFARTVWDAQIAHDAEAPLHTDPPPDQRSNGSYANVADYPPLYYLTLVPAYSATHALGGTTLGAVTVMRLVSALYAGVTLLALFALLGELFPGRHRLVTALALVCAYQPVFVWISGGINPDGALIALGTTMFWLFARAFRRGLTPAIAAGLGLTMVAAPLVQVRGLGLGPGWAIGVLLLLWLRTPAASRLRCGLMVAGTAAAPLLVYELVNILAWDRPAIPAGVSAAAGSGAPPGQPATGFASFLWQYLLPRIGSMTDFFHVSWTVKDLWVPMWVGKFGWYDYQFPNAVNRVALVLYLVVAAGALVALVPQLRRRANVRWLTLVYALLAAGLVFAMARVAYPMRAGGGLIFEQARYLMPLIALYALAFGLAASLLRRRAALALSAFTIICMLQLLYAFALTIQRYYV